MVQLKRMSSQVLTSLKKTTFEKLLSAYEYVLVVVDATDKNVIVPPKYKTLTNLGLYVGLKLSQPRLDMQGVSDILSFDNVKHSCKFSWESVQRYCVNKEFQIVYVKSEGYREQ